MAKTYDFTDEQILAILDLRDHEGWTASEIGARFGASKGTIIGLLNRIRKADQPDTCRKKDNMNGGMKRGWWRR